MKALFLDRDGVINENLPTHVKSWREFSFIPRSLDALRLLSGSEYRIIVVTNQAIINRKIVSRETVEEINQRMVAEVRRHGGRIDAVLYCPHRPDEGCNCRKPQPGILLHAADQWGLDLTKSLLIGDALTDMQAGLAVGCECVMVRTGRGQQQLAERASRAMAAYHIMNDLWGAARWIIMTGEQRRLHARPNTLVPNYLATSFA